MLSTQLDVILPGKDYTTKKFMWGCVLGFKKYMTHTGENGTLVYKEHKPGFVIKENSIKYWVDHLDQFKGWEVYVPSVYIKKIKQ